MGDWQLTLRMGVTSAIIVAFYVLLVKLGLVAGLGLPLILSGLALFVAIQYIVGTRGVLWQTDAHELPRSEFRALYENYEALCEQMEFSTPPRLMVARMGEPNAFAVGRKGSGTIVVSPQLIEMLDFEEMRSVLAHELAHLDNRDSVLMVFGASISTLIGIVVYVPVALMNNAVVSGLRSFGSVVAKFFVGVFLRGLSRYREIIADRDAADAIGSGEPLANALEKIERADSDSAVGANVSALCITSFEDGLLSTHPSVEKRIERLESR